MIIHSYTPRVFPTRVTERVKQMVRDKIRRVGRSGEGGKGQSSTGD